MASFKYSFQKVVDLKESEKTQAEWILSDAIGQLKSVEKQLTDLLEEQSEWGRKLEISTINAAPLSEIIDINQYMDHLESCIKKKRLEVQKAQEQVNQKKYQLAEKMKEEKVWQKAKEHAFDQYKQELQQKEQMELDEMATIRYMIPTP